MGKSDNRALLGVLIFLVLASLPPIIFLSISSRLISSISMTLISMAATIGLLVLTLLFMLLAVVFKPRKRAQHYHWESVFPEEQHEDILIEKKQPVSPNVAVRPKTPGRAFAAVAVIAVVLLLSAILALGVPGIKESFFGNASNSTKVLKNYSTDAPFEKNDSGKAVQPLAVKNVSAGNESFVISKLASGFGSASVNLASRIGRGLQIAASKSLSLLRQIPEKAWFAISIAAVSIVLLVASIVSYRSGQLAELPDWFSVSAAALWSSVKKHPLRSFLGAILVVLAAIGFSALIFRKKLVNFSFVDLFLSLRDFASAYRFYILIGILVLAVTIGILALLERKGKA